MERRLYGQQRQAGCHARLGATQETEACGLSLLRTEKVSAMASDSVKMREAQHHVW